jgi:transposase InsO family protein
VERVNLTIRQGVAALARWTWATAQAAPALLAQLDWWRGYYHFVRPHASLRVPLAAPIERVGGANHSGIGNGHRRWQSG